MSDASLHHDNQSQPVESPSFQRMRWFLLIVIVIWLLAAMLTTVVVTYITKSLLSLSLFSTLTPPAYLLYWITKHLFPMDKRRYRLEELKIRHSAEKQHNKR